jgi:hypothetical protein
MISEPVRSEKKFEVPVRQKMKIEIGSLLISFCVFIKFAYRYRCYKPVQAMFMPAQDQAWQTGRPCVAGSVRNRPSFSFTGQN